MELFQTGLRPYWLFQARELAQKNGVLDLYPAWLAASYRLQAASLKSNLEAARRSQLAGTSVWLFQDYPNCAEGVVDMFGRPKGLSAEEFRQFNSPTVLLLDVPRRSWWDGETAELKFVVSRFEDAACEAAPLRWKLADEAGGIIASGKRKELAIRSGEVQELPAFTVQVPTSSRAGHLTLSAELADANGTISNSWSLWAFPHDRRTNAASEVLTVGFDALRVIYPDVGRLEDGPVPPQTRLLVSTHLSAAARAYLEEGGRLLLLDPEHVFAVEKTNFRLSSWDGGGPSGTIVATKHPALRQMPTDGWCDLQFYPLMQKSKTVLLAQLPARIEPLVRCIDRPTRLADRAYLFEAAVGRGKLLVSGFNFAGGLAQEDPAAMFLLDQLVRYALGPDFNPKSVLTLAALQTKAAK